MGEAGTGKILGGAASHLNPAAQGFQAALVPRLPVSVVLAPVSWLVTPVQVGGYPGFSACEPLLLLLCSLLQLSTWSAERAVRAAQAQPGHDGQVQEPHRAQPELQGAPERHQEGQEAEVLVAQGGAPGSRAAERCALNGELRTEARCVLAQMEPKFLRNQVPGLIALPAIAVFFCWHSDLLTCCVAPCRGMPRSTTRARGKTEGAARSGGELVS